MPCEAMVAARLRNQHYAPDFIGPYLTVLAVKTEQWDGWVQRSRRGPAAVN
jgi:hypothetical protein